MQCSRFHFTSMSTKLHVILRTDNARGHNIDQKRGQCRITEMQVAKRGQRLRFFRLSRLRVLPPRARIFTHNSYDNRSGLHLLLSIIETNACLAATYITVQNYIYATKSLITARKIGFQKKFLRSDLNYYYTNSPSKF